VNPVPEEEEEEEGRRRRIFVAPRPDATLSHLVKIKSITKI
jgi:hypothetical protein